MCEENEIFVKPTKPGLPASMNQILESVGDAHRGDIILAPVHHPDRLAHSRWRLKREYPACEFKILIEKRKGVLHLKIHVI